MFCNACNKLMVKYGDKKCLRCQGKITTNISVICDQCSNNDKQCSACLKKIQLQPKKRAGCGTCGGKI